MANCFKGDKNYSDWHGYLLVFLTIKCPHTKIRHSRIDPFKCTNIEKIRSKLPTDIVTLSDLLDDFENLRTLQIHDFDEESFKTVIENDDRIEDSDVLVITSNGPLDNDFIDAMSYMLMMKTRSKFWTKVLY